MHSDICIIGGGFCGTVIAHALTQLGLNCSLLEKKASLEADKKDNRAFVISYGSGLILNNLNLWSNDLQNYKIDQVKFSMKGFFGSTTIQASDFNVPWLGSVVKAYDWQQHCLKKATLPQQIFYNVKDVKIAESEVAFVSETKQHIIRTNFIIAADGSNSTISKQLGMSPITELSGYSALVVPVTNISDSPWLRSTQHASLAYIPHAKDHGVLVWTGKTEVIHKLKTPKVLNRFTKASAKSLSRSNIIVDQAYLFPVISQSCEIAKKNAINGVSIGNALHTLLPIAAQGFNLGIRDCAHLVDKIASSNNVNWQHDFLTARLKDGNTTRNISTQALTAYAKAKPFGGLASLGLLAANSRLNKKFYNSMLHSLGLALPHSELLINKIETLRHVKNG